MAAEPEFQTSGTLIVFVLVYIEVVIPVIEAAAPVIEAVVSQSSKRLFIFFNFWGHVVKGCIIVVGPDSFWEATCPFPTFGTWGRGILG